MGKRDPERIQLPDIRTGKRPFAMLYSIKHDRSEDKMRGSFISQEEEGCTEEGAAVISDTAPLIVMPEKSTNNVKKYQEGNYEKL